ncbi:hypothetical protein BDV93DRAFT_509314 [Ceratobasidium sp. AG-I]|nr:hypothetical protein BDV93DRAFT_509314 [Ceratobasidium sp. AG-I]
MSTTFDHIPGKIILHGQVVAQEGKADKVQTLLTNIRDYSTSDKEPGCLTYRVNRSGNEFFIFEEYENADAIKAHFSGPGFQALIGEVQTGTLVAGEPKITYYEEV